MPVTQHQFCKLSLSNIKLAMKIKELRSRKHLTQKQLADSAGISEAAIRNYETGANAPRASRLEALANALGVRPEALRSYDFGDGGSVTFNALFQLADGYGLYPRYGEHDYHLVSGLETPRFLSTFIKQWSEAYVRWVGNDERAYKSWQRHYKLPQAQAPINRKAFDEQGPYRPRDAESLLAENIKLRQANEELTKRNLELEKMRDRLLAILSGTA